MNPIYRGGRQAAAGGTTFLAAIVASLTASVPGLPRRTDARILAMNKVREIGTMIGGPMTRRLAAYCVEGRTPKEIAASYGGQVPNRRVADTLDLDLQEMAQAMNFAK